jgi:hypothetical protein
MYFSERGSLFWPYFRTPRPRTKKSELTISFVKPTELFSEFQLSRYNSGQEIGDGKVVGKIFTGRFLAQQFFAKVENTYPKHFALGPSLG